MTDNHPLLTLENIMYWYWYSEPKWSGTDIAKEVGCSKNTVYRFMKANNIPIRNHSEASINAWKWEDKKYIKQFERYEELTVENVLKWYWKNDPAWSLGDIADHICSSETTVLNFMKFHSIPRRDNLEANKERVKCPQKKFIKYHKLTVDNINQWYWNNSPPWSITDIAKKIGCSPSNVSLFMRENNIPRRNHKQASLNIHKCEAKHKNYNFNDPIRKQKFIEALKKRNERTLSKSQFEVLSILIDENDLEITDFKKLSCFKDKSKKSIRGVLRRLHKRNLIERREEQYKGKVNVFKYKITPQGKKIFEFHI